MTATQTTLREAVEGYLSAKAFRPRTVAVFRREVHRFFENLLEEPIEEITFDLITRQRKYIETQQSGLTTGGIAARNVLTVQRWHVGKRAAEQPQEQPQPLVNPKDITLRRVLEDYLTVVSVKKSTEKNYRQRLNCYLSDWLDQPVTSITKQMVQDRHRQIPGKSSANSTMLSLQTLLRYAGLKWEAEDGTPLIKANPVRRLSELKLWHRNKRRKDVIHLREIGKWFLAVWRLENRTARDLILLLLFTGFRWGEGASLEWRQCDLKNGVIIIPEEKSKNGEELRTPMSTFVWRLLQERALTSDSQWVFPGKRADAHITSVQNAQNEVIKITGVRFMPHSLRRTFISIGDEVEIPVQVVKNLVNHVSGKDVTEGYTIRSLERLRRATQKITDAIMQEVAREMAGTTRQSKEAEVRKMLALPTFTRKESKK